MSLAIRAEGRSFLRALDALGEWVLSIALPRVCVGCKELARPKSALCQTCRDRCLSESIDPGLPEGMSSLVRGPRLSGPVRRLVHGLKYEGHRAAARDLVELVLERSTFEKRTEFVFVPVPLTDERRRERGYNQAQLLAQELSKRTGIPVAPKFLLRKRFHGSQTRRSGEERRDALAGMFGRGRDFDSGRIPILVDDVLTTGATLSACAAVCLHGGVPEVRGVCMAWAGEA